MFLLVVFLILVALICGPIYLGRLLLRHWQTVSAMTSEERAAYQAEQWREAGRSFGGFLFWTWTLFWGVLLVFGLWAYAQIP
jgi:hypothetical protein